MSRALLATTSHRFHALRPACSCPLSTLPPPLPLHRTPASLSPLPLPSNHSALSLLSSQPSHYISALLLGRRYLLTPNDVLTVPKLKGVKPGDRIALTRILEVGSRDYTLRASSPSPSPSPSPAEALKPVSARPSPRDFQRHPSSLPHLPPSVVQASLVVLEHTKGRMFEVEKFKRRKGYRRTLRSKLEFTKLRVGEIVLGKE